MTDVHIISGMDAIINQDNIRSGIDLKELERKMISGGIIQQRARDPTDKFNAELKDAAKKLGISFDQQNQQAKTSKLPSVSIDSPSRTRSPVRTVNSPVRSPVRSFEPQPESDDERDDDSASDHGDYDESDMNDTHITAGTFARASSPRPNYGNSIFNSGSELAQRTQEQERRSHIDNVMGNDSTISFSLEKEKREDMKSSMLAEIDSLIAILMEEDIDLTRIPKVNQQSSFEEVEAVLRTLRHKNDSVRYCTFAEEFMLFGAYALEELFDGKRIWLGRYQPDVTGWHNHVNVKLKRMRHDTGQLVSNVMQDYNIGAGMRVLLELVPNLILYSRMRRSQHNQSNLNVLDDEMAGANARLSALTH